MKKFGYIQKGLDEQQLSVQLNALIKYGCSQVFIETANDQELSKLVTRLDKNMELVVYNFASLNKRLNELALFLTELAKTEISVVSIEEKINSNQAQAFKIAGILNLAITVDLSVINQRRVTSVNRASSVRELGRPSLDNDKVSEIIFFHSKKKMSFREISEATGVSLGTVHKYVKEYETKNENL